MAWAELCTRWTARAAMMLLGLTLALRFGPVPRWRLSGFCRWLWTAGCGFFLLHTACAFQFYHGWSHQKAYETTAHQTAEVTGWDWGGGLYFNYAFGLLWLVDTAWWWIPARSYHQRPRWIEWPIQGFMAFMAFNATVVFVAGSARIIAATVSALILGLIAYQAWVDWKQRAPVNGRV